LVHDANIIIVSANDNEGNSASSSIEVVFEDFDQLIQAYGPVVYHHSDEQYFPDDVEWVLDNSPLEWCLVNAEHDYDNIELTDFHSVQTNSEDFMDDIEEHAMADPNSTDDRFRYYPLFSEKSANLDRAKALVRVCPWGYSYTDIQFYIFYPFNGPERVHATVNILGTEQSAYKDLEYCGRHWADWEAAILRFSNNPVELMWVGISQHGTLYWYTPDELTLSGSHPVVYAAKFSHAIYSSAGTHLYEEGKESGFMYDAYAKLYDYTSSDIVWETFQQDNYRIISSAVPGYDVTEPSWVNYRGRWGPPLPNRDWIMTVHIILIPAKEVDYREVGMAAFGLKYEGETEDRLWWPPSVTISPYSAYEDTDLTISKSG